MSKTLRIATYDENRYLQDIDGSEPKYPYQFSAHVLPCLLCGPLNLEDVEKLRSIINS